MFKFIDYGDRLGGFTTLTDIYSYRDKGVMIELDALSMLLDESFTSYIGSNRPYENAIYVGDNWKPSLELANDDTFLVNVNGNYHRFVPGQNTPKNKLYLFSRRWNGKFSPHGDGIIRVVEHFGDHFRLNRSNKALQKLFAYVAMESHLKDYFMYHLTVQPTQVNCEVLFPMEEMKQRREEILNDYRRRNPALQVGGIRIEGLDYCDAFRNLFAARLGSVLKPIAGFLDSLGECYVDLHYNQTYLFITKGIDYRYIAHFKNEIVRSEEEEDHI